MTFQKHWRSAWKTTQKRGFWRKREQMSNLVSFHVVILQTRKLEMTASLCFFSIPRPSLDKQPLASHLQTSRFRRQKRSDSAESCLKAYYIVLQLIVRAPPWCRRPLFLGEELEDQKPDRDCYKHTPAMCSRLCILDSFYPGLGYTTDAPVYAQSLSGKLR